MQKTQTTCLAILATIAVSFCLYFLKTVLLPFVIALFVVIGCRPIVDYIERRLNLHRFLAFVVAFLIGVASILAFALLIWLSIDDLARNSASYERRLNNILEWVVEHVPAASGSESSPTIETAETPPELEPDEENRSRAVEELLTSISLYVRGQMLILASSLSTLLSYGVLILIFVFFLLLGRSERGEAVGIVAEIEEQVRKYLVMKTVISLLTGLAFGFVLWLFGVPLAIVFGLLAFLLNYIPNFGPLISSLLPVPFLVLNSGMAPSSAVFCFLSIVAIQFVSGNVLEPRIMGRSFDVSPVVLLLTLMFFGLIWGIVGMFLATPLVSIVKIVLQQRPATRPFADLMAGRLDSLGSLLGNAS